MEAGGRRCPRRARPRHLLLVVLVVLSSFNSSCDGRRRPAERTATRRAAKLRRLKKAPKPQGLPTIVFPEQSNADPDGFADPDIDVAAPTELSQEQQVAPPSHQPDPVMAQNETDLDASYLEQLSSAVFGMDPDDLVDLVPDGEVSEEVPLEQQLGPLYHQFHSDGVNQEADMEAPLERAASAMPGLGPDEFSDPKSDVPVPAELKQEQEVGLYHKFNSVVKNGTDLHAPLERVASAMPGLVLPKTSRYSQRIVINKENSTGMPPDVFEKLPESDLPANLHRTCAITGSSALLLAAKGGEIIDDHDAVFRMNDSPLEGYGEYVGEKTTYRLLNTVAVQEYLHGGRPSGKKEENTVLFSPLSLHHAAELTEMYPDDHFLILSHEFLKSTHEQWSQMYDRMADAGFVHLYRVNRAPVELETLFLAFHLCERVHLYGFGYDSALNLTHHYFESEPVDAVASAFEFHDKFLQLMEHHDLLRICRHDSPSLECHLPRSDYSDTSAYLWAAEQLATTQPWNGAGRRMPPGYIHDDRQLR